MLLLELDAREERMKIPLFRGMMLFKIIKMILLYLLME